MAGTDNSLLYDQVVRVTHVYLGPAADRFINRQVENHLHKAPQDISEGDLERLISWIRVAVSLLTDDTEIIEEYTAQLEKLAHPELSKKINNRQRGGGHGPSSRSTPL